MKIGLVGYYNFGNYGDELFVETFKSLFAGSELTILDGVRRHDPDQIAEQDCIVIGGGDLVIPSAYAERYWDRALLTRPVFIAGVGVASRHTVSRETVRRMRRFFQDPNVRQVAARDPVSRDLIAEHLAPRVPVRWFPDPVAGNAFERKSSTGRTLGLVLRARPAVDSDALEGLVARAYAQGYRVKRLVLGTGLTAEQDLTAAKELDLPYSEVVVRDTITDLTQELASCDVVVSQRFHGCVVAMMMGIPTIGIGASNKLATWFEMFEKEPFLAATDDVTLAGRLIDPMYAISQGTIARIRRDARGGLGELRRGVMDERRRRRGRRRRRRRYGHGERYGHDHYDGYGGYGHLDSAEMRHARKRDRSPRLERDPRALLHPRSELSRYRNALAERNGAGYVEHVDQLIDATPELASLPAATRAIVTIPVAALAEHRNIYGTLSLYAQQGAAALDQTTVLAYVNYPDRARLDPPDSTTIDATLAAIERASVDFPALRVAVVDDSFPHGVADGTGGVIGYVARRMYDVAMLSVERAMRQGGLAPDEDVLLVRNDADATGMEAHYLDRLIRAMGAHPESDVFQGAVRWGTAHTCDYPGFGVLVSVKEALRALTARGSGRYRIRPSTTGTNVAVRMSTFAAVGGVGNTRYSGAGVDDLEIGIRIHEARLRQASDDPGASPDAGARRPVRFVPGAQIDASGERSFATYSSGRSITATWDSFNAGAHGYTSRVDAAGPRSVTPGSIDVEAAIDRIERSIEDLVGSWYTDPALVDTALRLVIGRSDPFGNPTYEARWREGRFTFMFTPAGRRWLATRLLGDGSAGVEPYWRRSMRSLYGSVSPNGERRPARFVAAITSRSAAA